MKVVKCVECEKCGNLIKLDLAHSKTGPATKAQQALANAYKPEGKRTYRKRRYHKKWTKEEDKKLGEVYNTMKPLQLEKEFRRSYLAIKNRASKLGFRRKHKQSRSWL